MNASAIAEIVGCSSEYIHSILAGIRDEVVEHVLVRRQSVVLNFGFGALNLRASGQVEFKSGCGGLKALQDLVEDAIPPCEILDTPQKLGVKLKKHHSLSKRDVVSKVSLAERSLNFMQQRQASQNRALTNEKKNRAEIMAVVAPAILAANEQTLSKKSLVNTL